jgi:hypothetical protein
MPLTLLISQRFKATTQAIGHVRRCSGWTQRSALQCVPPSSRCYVREGDAATDEVVSLKQYHLYGSSVSTHVARVSPDGSI